jgi:hypothetical protein
VVTGEPEKNLVFIVHFEPGSRSSLKDFNPVAIIFPVHDLGMLFLQSGLDNGLGHFHEPVLLFPKHAHVVGDDVGNRADGELRTYIDVYRSGDEAKLKMRQPGKPLIFGLTRNDAKAMVQIHSNEKLE